MSDQVTTDQPPPAPPDAARRSTNGEIAQAIDLGWRVASLNALSPEKVAQSTARASGLLPNRRSLPWHDRVAVEVNALAGVAARAGVAISEGELFSLLDLAGAAIGSEEQVQAFRERLTARHVEFVKRLWAVGEPLGKAYELGNFLSDTQNRVASHPTDPAGELREVFDVERVQRMKLLLDDLQARIDPVAVHAVSHQLDRWCLGIDEALTAGRGLDYDALARQTIVWRQMLTGDKEPEAWIGHAGRLRIRSEVIKQMWLRAGPMLCVAVPALAGLGWALESLYESDRDAFESAIASIVAVAGVFGVTRASMAGALRKGIVSWSGLMWNRALATVVCRETSLFGEFYAPSRSQRVRQRVNSTWTRSPAFSDSRSSGTKA